MHLLLHNTQNTSLILSFIFVYYCTHLTVISEMYVTRQCRNEVEAEMISKYVYL